MSSVTASTEQVENVILKMRGVTKDFPGVRALDSVDFTLRRGEIHVLVGENGAGKSTLIKILTGAYSKDAGTICINADEVAFASPKDAVAHGIGVVFQEFSLVPALSVAENLYLGRSLSRRFAGLKVLDWPVMNSAAFKALAEFGVEVDPKAKVRDLSVATRQLVEIAKALALQSKILIMDEPTAALSPQEIDHLFAVLKDLKSQGVSIIYISHRLGEIEKLGDRVTVLKDGKRVDTVETSQVSTSDIVRMMVGRDVEQLYPERKPNPGEVILEVSNLSSSRFHDVSFSLHAGEILGITGLIGSGKTEVVRSMFGADGVTSGKVMLEGKTVDFRSPNKAIRHGIGLLPEDRRSQGLILPLNIRTNISLPNLRHFLRFGFISPSLESQEVNRLIREVNVRPPDPTQRVEYLSGGNQQKVVVAKWLCSRSKVYIFDEPTRGIDVGAKAEIYELMALLAESGASILMVSSEIPEILGMCDRVIVMHKGSIAAKYSSETATKEKILVAALRGANK